MEPDGPGGLEIYHQLELGRLLGCGNTRAGIAHTESV